MNLLMAEHTNFESVCRVGCHHLAQGLVRRGNQVTYLSAYLTPLHLSHLLTSKKQSVIQRFSNFLSNGKQWEEGFYSYVPFSFLPYTSKPLLDNLQMANLQPLWTAPNLLKKLKKRGPFDALLIGDPRYLPLINSIEAPINILRLTDDVFGFPSTPKSLKILIEQSLAKCSHVIVTSMNLSKQLEKWFGYDRAIYMPNGVEAGHFMDSSFQEPEDLAAIPSPRVLYIGMIDERMDKELVSYCAEALPEVSFVFIGPGRISMKKMSNIHFLGTRDYSELPNYLKSSQAAMIPFRKTQRTDSMCSIKLLQYLASGLPTIATRLTELELQNPPIFFAKDPKEFAEQIEKALVGGTYPEQYQQYAKLYSWENNVKELEKLIKPQIASFP